jgi:hypothetical protein
VGEPPEALAPPVGEPPEALAPPIAEPPEALAPPIAEPPEALAPPIAEPPVLGWVAPPVGLVWLLVVELQPRLTPAAYSSAKAAMVSNCSFDLSAQQVCIAFILREEQRSRGTSV